jgi:hypothetical protein
MTTRITSSGPNPSVQSAPSAARVTAAPARPFRQVVETSAHTVVAGAEAAVRRLPGGPILAAAFRPGPGLVAPGSASSPEGSAGTAAGGAGLGGAGSAGVGAGGAGLEGGGDPALDAVTAGNSDRTLYYLELQQRMNLESQHYTAVSNVLKARHDTIKNAIGNIR